MLGGGWERLSRVSGLGGGKTDKLGTTESKGSVDEDGAKSFKAMFERARIMPVVGTKVSAVDFRVDTSAVHNDGENDKTDDRCDFDHTEKEFDCCTGVGELLKDSHSLGVRRTNLHRILVHQRIGRRRGGKGKQRSKRRY